MIQIGILGCGTIGSALAKSVVNKFSGKARLKFVSDRHPEQISKLRKKLSPLHLEAVSISQLVRKSDFIIEAGSVKAAQEIVPLVLKAGKQILVLSVGGILGIKNFSKLLCKTNGRVYIPSGAIAGIDGVLASKNGGIKSVRITTRKPLKGLQQAPFFIKNGFNAEKIKKPTLIFKGNAAEAIENFPENVNVAATLSLAGIGPQKTQVRIFTSPTYRYNMHEVEIESGYGKIVTQVTNLPSKENPKTSALAIGSALAALEKIFSSQKIGT